MKDFKPDENSQFEQQEEQYPLLTGFQRRKRQPYTPQQGQIALQKQNLQTSTDLFLPVGGRSPQQVRTPGVDLQRSPLSVLVDHMEDVESEAGSPVTDVNATDLQGDIEYLETVHKGLQGDSGEGTSKKRPRLLATTPKAAFSRPVSTTVYLVQPYDETEDHDTESLFLSPNHKKRFIPLEVGNMHEKAHVQVNDAIYGEEKNEVHAESTCEVVSFDDNEQENRVHISVLGGGGSSSSSISSSSSSSSDHSSTLNDSNRRRKATSPSIAPHYQEVLLPEQPVSQYQDTYHNIVDHELLLSAQPNQPQPQLPVGKHKVKSLAEKIDAHNCLLDYDSGDNVELQAEVEDAYEFKPAKGKFPKSSNRGNSKSKREIKPKTVKAVAKKQHIPSPDIKISDDNVFDPASFKPEDMYQPQSSPLFAMNELDGLTEEQLLAKVVLKLAGLHRRNREFSASLLESQAVNRKLQAQLHGQRQELSFDDKWARYGDRSSIVHNVQQSRDSLVEMYKYILNDNSNEEHQNSEYNPLVVEHEMEHVLANQKKAPSKHQKAQPIVRDKRPSDVVRHTVSSRTYFPDDNIPYNNTLQFTEISKPSQSLPPIPISQPTNVTLLNAKPQTTPLLPAHHSPSMLPSRHTPLTQFTKVDKIRYASKRDRYLAQYDAKQMLHYAALFQ